MGETLGIAHNVFEKMEREKDRKERMKKYEEWLKDQEKRKTRLKDIQARLKEAERTGIYTPEFRSPSLSKRGASTSSLLSVENDAENEVKREQLKKYEEWRKEKKQSLGNMRSQDRDGEFIGTSPSTSMAGKKELGSRSASASGIPCKEYEDNRKDDFAEFEVWRQEQEEQILKQASEDNNESGIFINSLSPPSMAKRCYSTSGLPDENADQSSKLGGHAISTEWFKTKSVSRMDSNVAADQTVTESIPPDLRGSKLKFIGSSSAKTISIPKDLEAITLDEKENQSTLVCGKCTIL